MAAMAFMLLGGTGGMCPSSSFRRSGSGIRRRSRRCGFLGIHVVVLCLFSCLLIMNDVFMSSSGFQAHATLVEDDSQDSQEDSTQDIDLVGANTNKARHDGSSKTSDSISGVSGVSESSSSTRSFASSQSHFQNSEDESFLHAEALYYGGSLMGMRHSADSVDGETTKSSSSAAAAAAATTTPTPTPTTPTHKSSSESVISSSGVPDFMAARHALALLSQQGSTRAQALLGLAHASGLGMPYGVDNARALLHLYFAASNGDIQASMALAHRHSLGLGVPRSCQAAVLYLAPVAERVAERERLPGPNQAVEKVRLSVTTDSSSSAARELDVVQYYQYSADMGNSDAQTAMGQLFNFGMRGIEQDHSRALHYFQRAAAQGDNDALAHLGHMYANGLGVEQDNATAVEYFEKAAANGHPNAEYGLGYLHLAGHGVAKDYAKAVTYFKAAADQSHVEAQFHLGVMALKGWGMKQDVSKAYALFHAAGTSGHVLSLYNLAMLQLRGGHGTSPNCRSALGVLKNVAERGQWASLSAAHKAFSNKAYGRALTLYVRAAEMGIEVAESNVAYMLTKGLGLAPDGSDAEVAELVANGGVAPWWYAANGNATGALGYALRMRQRAATQGNLAAMMAVGDAFYYGRGVTRDWAQAVAVYRHASHLRNAQAFFNLGSMQERGEGLPRDLHLAKRFYDQAKSTNTEAAVPVMVALAAMRVCAWMEKSVPWLARLLFPHVRRLHEAEMRAKAASSSSLENVE
mmetsp:Transcript_16053/g.40851  ORF Transcript_16053/g.40851 Transcript_16053/m.40851 type:complete len:748 (+) Transcript_16053:59-2302(+)